MFGWLRRRAPVRPIPDALWASTLAACPFLRGYGPRVRELAAGFLARKEFHGAHGFEVSDEVAVMVAAQAVLPVLHLGLDWYDDFVGIVVHDFQEVLAGEAMDRGPVMLNWRDVSRAGETAAEGYNVVIHEFAHKLDMRDGAPDGCPPLPSRRARAEWQAVMEAEYEAFREKVIVAERFGGEPPWLDDYAATAPEEFFAVACEAYFVAPARFEQEFPVLRRLFDGFFLAR